MKLAEANALINYMYSLIKPEDRPNNADALTQRNHAWNEVMRLCTDVRPQSLIADPFPPPAADMAIEIRELQKKLEATQNAYRYEQFERARLASELCDAKLRAEEDCRTIDKLNSHVEALKGELEISQDRRDELNEGLRELITATDCSPQLSCLRVVHLAIDKARELLE